MQDEIERLQIMHDVLTKTFDSRHIFPPISRPRRILDCGYGTASWASAVADEHPECEVRFALSQLFNSNNVSQFITKI